MSETAIQAEANGEDTLAVEWRDLTFHLPLDRADWPYEAGLALEEGKYLVAIRELLPESEFEAFLARKPKGRDAGDIITSIVEGLGVKDAGESPASSD